MSETRDQTNEASAGDAAPQPVIDSTSSNVQVTMSRMSTQLQTVIDAAERAAEAIRSDAEEQARNHLAEAQRKADEMTAERVGLIADLTDDLVKHATTVRTHSEQMVQALEEAIESVTVKLEQPELAGSPPADPTPAPDAQGSLKAATPEEERLAQAEQHPHEPEAEAKPEAEEQPRAETEPEPTTDVPVSEDVLLQATRLAVAGNDHEAIAIALREEYGVADPEPVVRRVLGEG